MKRSKGARPANWGDAKPASRQVQSGTTLVEMLVVLAIVSVIVVSVGLLIRTGVDYYLYSTEQVEVQRQGLFSLTRLSRELAPTNFDSVAVYSAPVSGIVFASPRDALGTFQRDGSGRIIWTKLICYYVADFNGRSTLLRKEELLATPAVEVPDPNSLGRTAAYFDGLATTPRVIARGVVNFNAVLRTDAVELSVTSRVENGRSFLEMDMETTIVPRN